MLASPLQLRQRDSRLPPALVQLLPLQTGWMRLRLQALALVLKSPLRMGWQLLQALALVLKSPLRMGWLLQALALVPLLLLRTDSMPPWLARWWWWWWWHPRTGCSRLPALPALGLRQVLVHQQTQQQTGWTQVRPPPVQARSPGRTGWHLAQLLEPKQAPKQTRLRKCCRCRLWRGQAPAQVLAPMQALVQARRPRRRGCWKARRLRRLVLLRVQALQALQARVLHRPRRTGCWPRQPWQQPWPLGPARSRWLRRTGC